MRAADTITQPSPSTYVSMAQGGISAEHADIVARGLNADKQLLILTDKSLSSTATSDLTEKDLIAKANTALELMADPSTNKPPNVSFIAAKILCSGNTLYQLNSIPVTVWLHNSNVQKAFLLAYSSSANICSRLFHVDNE